MNLHPVSLEQARKEMQACKACQLHNNTHQAVPGIGSQSPTIMFIGEGPGEQEDLQGKPFVGPAGQELQGILAEMDFSFNEIYVTNMVRHRPPGNRTPTWDEIQICAPKFLAREIEVLAPKVIVCLGRCAAESLMKLQGMRPPRGTIRGTSYTYKGIPVYCTWHPSYVIRNGDSSQVGSEANRLRSEMIDDITQAWNRAVQTSDPLPY
jgi:uracil-DNA glycosylase family 4